jgi:hypothetical protein
MKKSFGQILTDAMALEYENIQQQIKSELLQKPYARIALSWCMVEVCLN